MTKVLYQLGDFQFNLQNGAPQTLDWNADYRWEQQDRLLRDPANQFLGPGSQAITFDGVLFPGFSGKQNTMETLRTQARRGTPYMLSDGRGKIYGKWCIKTVREGKGTFMDNGAARQIDFNIQLVYYGEDRPGLAASPLSTAAANPLANIATGIAQIPSYTALGSAFQATDWLQSAASQAVAQTALASGFNPGQLATIASTAAGIAGQVSSGDFVGAALNTFGMAGIPANQNNAWAQIGINAANLAQSFVNGQGPTGMAIAMEVANQVGAPALQQLGIVKPADTQSINSLLNSTATVTEILKVDPKVTASLQPLITLTGG